jgi:acyl carrier protein
MARGYEAPEGETEQRLARIWAELLQVEPVGPEDNFFELGGHSLTALRLMARVGSVFGVQIGVAALFAAPTLRQLARRVSESEKPPEPWKLIQLQPLARRRRSSRSTMECRITSCRKRSVRIGDS